MIAKVTDGILRLAINTCGEQPSSAPGPTPTLGPRSAFEGRAAPVSRARSEVPCKERFGTLGRMTLVLDPAPPASLADRIVAIDWPKAEVVLDATGFAHIPSLLSADEARGVAALFGAEGDTGAAWSWGATASAAANTGESFAYPLPELVQKLGTGFSPRLRAVANRWNEAMGLKTLFPEDSGDFTLRCHAAGQARPTPLLLQYGEGDYNCLHQDLYGEHVFPLQVDSAVFAGAGLCGRGIRPDRAAAADAVASGGRSPATGRCGGVRGSSPAGSGDAGLLRVNLRHGVSRIRAGRRHTLGVIFHDAA